MAASDKQPADRNFYSTFFFISVKSLSQRMFYISVLVSMYICDMLCVCMYMYVCICMCVHVHDMVYITTAHMSNLWYEMLQQMGV